MLWVNKIKSKKINSKQRVDLTRTIWIVILKAQGPTRTFVCRTSTMGLWDNATWSSILSPLVSLYIILLDLQVGQIRCKNSFLLRLWTVLYTMSPYFITRPISTRSCKFVLPVSYLSFKLLLQIILKLIVFILWLLK